MKIKNILSLCKKRKVFYLVNCEDGTQWLGDGCSLYPLDGMPFMTMENLQILAEISDDLTKYILKTCEAGESYDFSDASDDETQVELEDIRIVSGGKTMLPVVLNNSRDSGVKIVFIDARYLSPFGNYISEFEFYLNQWTVYAVEDLGTNDGAYRYEVRFLPAS